LKRIFLPLILQSVCYKSTIDRFFKITHNWRKIKDKHNTLKLLSLFHPHVSLYIFGKVTFRTTFSFQTSVAVVCYDLRTEEKRQDARKGVRNGKIKKVHGVRNETCSGDRKKLWQSLASDWTVKFWLEIGMRKIRSS